MLMTLAAPLALQVMPAMATPETMQAAIDAFTGGADVTEGGVELKIPALVENGNSVPLSVSAESPMTPDDYVEEIAIFNEINPLPDTVRFQPAVRAGRGADPDQAEWQPACHRHRAPQRRLVPHGAGERHRHRAGLPGGLTWTH